MEPYGPKLARDFYLRPTVQVAKELLGKYIVRVTEDGTMVAEITETEAYVGVEDKACHSYSGRRTPRTEIMYKLGGLAYIYMVYGMHCMFNVVTEEASNPSAVLVRACRPVYGHDQMAQRRYGKTYNSLSKARQRALLSGPGKVCQALAITMEHYGAFLGSKELFLTRAAEPSEFGIKAGPRVNIDYAEEAVDFPYRFQMVPVMKEETLACVPEAKS